MSALVKPATFRERYCECGRDDLYAYIRRGMPAKNIGTERAPRYLIDVEPALQWVRDNFPDARS